MTNIEAKILALLTKGWSYSQIQEELGVSSKTIAAAKKAHFPISESSNDALSRDTFLLRPQPPPATQKNIPQPTFQKTNIQNKHKMSTENDYYEDDDEISSPLELEKYRLKLTHELEMGKLQAAREDKERENKLREQEIILKREEIERDKRKVEEEKRRLLFRIKTLIESCDDAEYSYEDADDLLDEARELLSECEQYCYVYQITFQGSVSHSLIGKVISTLTDFLDDVDEGDSDDLKFDSSFKKQVSKVTYQNF